MWKIGITGSIATGKSTLLAAFASQGIPVFSADAAVADLYSGPEAAEVERLFPGVVQAGIVDRAVLAQRLSADPSSFGRLEALVHPLVRERIAAFLAAAEADGNVAAAVEIPLLFETGHDYGFDAIAVTHVDDAIQAERIMARPGMTVEKRRSLLARQLPQAEKKARATYLFDTARPKAEIDAMVAALVASLRASKDRR